MKVRVELMFLEHFGGKGLGLVTGSCVVLEDLEPKNVVRCIWLRSQEKTNHGIA